MAEVFKPLPSYQIKEGVFLVEGKARSAIYNTNNGNVYSINKAAEELILSSSKKDDYLDELTNIGLIDDKPVVSDIKLDIPPSNRLEFIWLSLTSRCNLKCLHCYNESSSSSDRDIMTHEDWESVIKQSALIGCEQMQFIGGEPMLNPHIFQLAETARNIGYKYIEIFSNGTLITRKDIEKIKHLGINIALSLYSNEAEVHDQITSVRGSFSKTIRTMELLKEAKINTRIGVVLMKSNEKTIGETLNLIKDFGFLGGNYPDIVRPIGRGGNNLIPNELLVRKYGLITSPSFITDLYNFTRNYFYNPCWYGKLSIDSSGEILPCITARNKSVGSVRENSIENIVNSEPTKKLWSLNKDKIETCCLCEYRYACGDCRPLSEADTNNPRGKTSRCTYEPLIGNWQ